MTSRGFLIRFIDIGLIVLFGFVMISDIGNSSPVEIAVAATADDETRPDQRALVRVRILPAGGFEISEPVSQPTIRVAHPSALEAVLRRVRDAAEAEDRRVLVLIEPDEASVVQRTVDVMDVCDRLGLAKSLRMALEASPTVAEGARR